MKLVVKSFVTPPPREVDDASLFFIALNRKKLLDGYVGQQIKGLIRTGLKHRLISFCVFPTPKAHRLHTKSTNTDSLPPVVTYYFICTVL